MIACGCEVCRSTDSRDKRLRCSAMIETEGARLVIDAGPDFRQQMLRAGVGDVSPPSVWPSASHLPLAGGGQGRKLPPRGGRFSRKLPP